MKGLAAFHAALHLELLHTPEKNWEIHIQTETLSNTHEYNKMCMFCFSFPVFTMALLKAPATWWFSVLCGECVSVAAVRVLMDTELRLQLRDFLELEHSVSVRSGWPATCSSYCSIACAGGNAHHTHTKYNVNTGQELQSQWIWLWHVVLSSSSNDLLEFSIYLYSSHQLMHDWKKTRCPVLVILCPL